MRFQGLDLNLLVTLDCLLTERNVSRAAEKLYLSQSATSGALARLREYFGDELLIQLGRNMVLTPRATELQPAVRNLLLQVEGTIIKRPEFNPATAHREIRIIASDYIVIAALAASLREIHRKAPNITFSLINMGPEPREMLERGEVDFLIIPDIYHSPDHPAARLFSDDFRAVGWSENPHLKDDTLSLQTFLKLGHVAVRFGVAGPSFEGWFVERFGKERLVEVTTPSYTAVPFLIVGTERVALMHTRLAEVFAQMMPLKLFQPPVDIPRVNEAIQWHVYNESDECLTWLREELISNISSRLARAAS